MIYCLIVDDEKEKVDVVAALIRQEVGSENVTIIESQNANDASEKMRETVFDLLLIDLNLPMRDGGSPVPDGGLKLLKQVSRGTNSLKRPTFVMGLTSYEDLAEKSLPEFQKHGWALIQYQASSNAWEEAVLNQCQHLADVRSRYDQTTVAINGFDICICTALAEPELKPLIDLMGLSPVTYEDDVTRYFQGVMSGNEREISICAASAPEMGVSGMACLTTKMLTKFKPKACFLVGICAGIKAEIGDLVVAESSFNYESGKVSQGEDELEAVFHPDPRYLSASASCVEAIRQFKSSNEVQFRSIASEYQKCEPPKLPNLRIGPVACGAAVIESEDTVTDLLDSNRKIEGLEMESYGFYLACRNSNRCNYVMVKAVCDAARPPKEDRYQEYCSFLSARFLQQFLLFELNSSAGLF